MSFMVNAQRWGDIANKIRQLDSQYKLVFGASSHQYQVMPIVDVTAIHAFETRNNIQLPQTYRDYLQYFAGGGVGPGHGISGFQKRIAAQDVSVPSLLKKPRQGTIDDEVNEDHPVNALQGVVKIATAGNPSDYFLVLNGELAGQVFWWNYGDMIGYEGNFAQWFENWLNQTQTKLLNYHAFATIKSGMTWDQVQSIMSSTPMRRQSIDGVQRIHFDKTPGFITLDDNERVLNISHVETPNL